MSLNNHYIVRLRHNRSLRYLNIMLLWISVLISIPALDLTAAPESSPIQRILPVHAIPFASPRILSKSAPEFSDILTILIDEPVFETHGQIHTALEYSSFAYIRILAHSLLYTQTTSSCL
jgi:hypothetical protein